LTIWKTSRWFFIGYLQPRRRKAAMQLRGKVLVASTTTHNTKKGTQFVKTRARILDAGPEAAGEVQVYWVDFPNEYALSDAEVQQIVHQEVTVEIRRVQASLGKDGSKVYLNVSGGAIVLDDGSVVQAKVRK
jgi:hypothetical protein